MAPLLTRVSDKTFISSFTKCVAGFLPPSDCKTVAPIGESKRSRFSTSSRIPAGKHIIYMNQQIGNSYLGQLSTLRELSDKICIMCY